MDVHTHRDLLPAELWINIFSYLPWESLGRVAQVCRQWRRLSEEHALWPPYFRLVRGIRQHQEPIRLFTHIRSTDSVYQAFASSILMLRMGRCHRLSIDCGVAKEMEIPFRPEKLERIDMHTAVVRGESQVALLEVATGKIIGVLESARYCALYKEILIVEEPTIIIIEARASGERLFSIPESHGRYARSSCNKHIVALILKRQGGEVLQIYDWKKRGLLLFERESQCFTNLRVTDEGHVLFQEGRESCGLYSLAQNKAIFFEGSLTGSIEGAAPEYSERHFLRFSPNNQLSIHRLKDGEELWHSQILHDIQCAMLVGERLVLYTENKVFAIWQLKESPRTRHLLIAMQISLEVEEGDCCELPNVFQHIIALKTTKSIVFVDLIEGKILRKIRAQATGSSVYFDGDYFREYGFSPGRLTVCSRKFFA